MDPTRSESLAVALRAKGVNKPCPRCGHPHFSVVGETNVQLVNVGLLGLAKTDIPAVLVGCNNCGYLTTHAINVLAPQPTSLLGGIGGLPSGGGMSSRRSNG